MSAGRTASLFMAGFWALGFIMGFLLMMDTGRLSIHSPRFCTAPAGVANMKRVLHKATWKKDLRGFVKLLKKTLENARYPEIWDMNALRRTTEGIESWVEGTIGKAKR